MSGAVREHARRPRVAIVDRCVPHYRRALYERLMQCPDAQFTIVAAARPLERIETVPFKPQGWRWIDAPARAVPFTRGRSVWQWGAARAGLSRRFDAIVMMANPNDPCLWLCALGARATGKRLLMWTHGYNRPEHGVRGVVRRLWFRLAHALLLYGRMGRTLAVQAGVSERRCHVIYNSLDVDEQERQRRALTPALLGEARARLGASAGEPIIATIARLASGKRLETLLEAHAALAARGRRARLAIIGEGPQRSLLERRAAELGFVDLVTFTGAVYDEARLAPLLSVADLAVVPGAVGLTAMHVLAYGVPLIIHDDPHDQGPEFEAVVPGSTGDTFHKGDAADLASVIERWLWPAPRRPLVESVCREQITTFYTPQRQAEGILRALRGEETKRGRDEETK